MLRRARLAFALLRGHSVMYRMRLASPDSISVNGSAERTYIYDNAIKVG